ncbi:MAG: tRNA-binding protein [Candidatus Geothermarchaeales archaeon]
MGTPEITFDEFRRLDMRVGTITSVERVPRTSKLYKILVDLGELGVRQTISSLVGHYEPEDLEGKKIIFLVNLRPTKFSGQLSQGMLLAAEKGEELALLTVDRDIADGVSVT